MKNHTAIQQVEELHAALRNLFRRNYEEYFPAGISPLESKFIGYVGDHQDEGGAISRDLIKAFGLRKATVSETVSSLIKKGYMQFVKDREDGRMKSIVLTEKGKDYFSIVTPIIEGFDCSFDDVLTKEESAQFEAAIQKLMAAIKERSKKK